MNNEITWVFPEAVEAVIKMFRLSERVRKYVRSRSFCHWYSVEKEKSGDS